MEEYWRECGNLQDEFVVRFNRREDHRAHLIQELFWLARLAYLVDIFVMLNMLNIILQRRRFDIHLKRPPKLHHSTENLQIWNKEFASTI